MEPTTSGGRNVRVVFSERSHLSGVSVRVDAGGYEEGATRWSSTRSTARACSRSHTPRSTCAARSPERWSICLGTVETRSAFFLTACQASGTVAAAWAPDAAAARCEAGPLAAQVMKRAAGAALQSGQPVQLIAPIAFRGHTPAARWPRPVWEPGREVTRGKLWAHGRTRGEFVR